MKDVSHFAMFGSSIMLQKNNDKSEKINRIFFSFNWLFMKKLKMIRNSFAFRKRNGKKNKINIKYNNFKAKPIIVLEKLLIDNSIIKLVIKSCWTRCHKHIIYILLRSEVHIKILNRYKN